MIMVSPRLEHVKNTVSSGPGLMKTGHVPIDVPILRESEDEKTKSYDRELRG